ncbi:6-phosphogluconate dehydrogenase [Candidatus Nitrosoglobus terrae]|uniref:6-phosphogluconate dehydrogenase n=1 Tax=Candidatus Nitrosoglobus terrae TaxID=1630141 RepID=A0A1Q2SMX8_9GAMM|nr:NAD(P)-dependent oxidoreductase [Candidatus Nitrosoglobus terrae]BAW80505.1 6-phosphogluconate dehydrogenase [Candidatus Nitrosoglobus terrae]
MRAGFIGLGTMGKPMAYNLAKGGFLSSVWNRTQIIAKTLAQTLNITYAQTPAELATAVEVICICVTGDKEVLVITEALAPNLNPQKIVIDFSTVSAETARQAAAIVRSQGGDFLDCPVSGGLEGARNSTLTMMVGGHQVTLEKIRPLLNTMGKSITHMGEVGTGQSTKAVNQIMAAGINQAVTEALAFGEAQGLDMDKAIEAISQGAAGNWFLEKRGKTMVQGTFNLGFKITLHHKDLSICKAMAAQLGFSLPLAEGMLTDYQQLIDQGFGEEDISALYRLKRPN